MVVSTVVLRPAGQVCVPARTKLFRPRNFFEGHRGGLCWASENFRNWILSVAKPMDSVPKTTLASFDLVCEAIDAKVPAKLPENHVFENASVFCAHLADMISRQPNGEQGHLLTNGHENIFYVCGVSDRVFVVRVVWLSGVQLWFMEADRSSDWQREGDRVFSSPSTRT